MDPQAWLALEWVQIFIGRGRGTIYSCTPYLLLWARRSHRFPGFPHSCYFPSCPRTSVSLTTEPHSLISFPHSHETLSTRGSLDSPVWLCFLSVIPEVRPTPKPGVPLNTAGHRRADPVRPSVQNCLKTHSALSHPASPFSSHPCPSHFLYSS